MVFGPGVPLRVSKTSKNTKSQLDIFASMKNKNKTKKNKKKKKKTRRTRRRKQGRKKRAERKTPSK